jgi:hypothetical protein
MTQRRFLWLLLAALAVISAAIILNGRRGTAPVTSTAALFPGLAAELNRVTTVAIRKGGAEPSTVLRKAGEPKAGEQWVVAERHDYPVDLPKLRRLLIALGDAVLREEKTSDAANYARIGVEDPGTAAATGAEIAVSTAGATGSAGATRKVIVGKSSGSGSFVRRTGEARSYLAEPAISFETEPRFWIDQRVTAVPLATIRSIEIKPADGAGYTLRRSAAGDAPFALDAVPAGRSALDAPLLAPSASTYGEINAIDVAQAGDIDFSRPASAVLTLADGNVVTLTGAANGDKRWITVTATKDAALEAKARGRAYELSVDRYAALFRPLEQLLQPKPAPAPKSPVQSKAPFQAKAPSQAKPPSQPHATPTQQPQNP